MTHSLRQSSGGGRLKICLSEPMPVCGALGTAGTKWFGIESLLFMSDLVDVHMIIKDA